MNYVHLNSFCLPSLRNHDLLPSIMSVTKSRLCWRKDLAEFRGLAACERSGFLVLLEWFENFRLRNDLEAGREAAKIFWRTEVLREDRQRE